MMHLLKVTDVYGESEATSNVLVSCDRALTEEDRHNVILDIYGDGDSLETIYKGQFYTLDAGCHGVKLEGSTIIPDEHAKVLRHYLLCVDLTNNSTDTAQEPNGDQERFLLTFDLHGSIFLDAPKGTNPQDLVDNFDFTTDVLAEYVDSTEVTSVINEGTGQAALY